ncbi:MAG TPA: TlpA disulfide reductase family protein [Polyangiaceae bacterium]|nr:TlpA disulfide reductase family protein [Polyangiaceae bacterium]
MNGDPTPDRSGPPAGTARDAPSRSTLGALGLVLILLAGFALLPRVLRPLRAAGVGRDAPDWMLPLVANGVSIGKDDGTLRLSELRGHAVLIDFWATWCEPCRVQAPIVDRLARRWRERGLVAVGVDTDGPDQGNPRAFALSRGLSYPIVHDTVGAASHAYGVEDLPTLVVVSRAGKIVAVRTGVTDDSELERLVRQAL